LSEAAGCPALLETTDLPVDQISADCGFGNAVTLRQNFAAAFSTTPTEYRRRFDSRVGEATSPWRRR